MCVLSSSLGVSAEDPCQLGRRSGGKLSDLRCRCLDQSDDGAAQFVTVGAKVAQGQTLLLIEAMKTFNQIKAPRAGTVTRILVESGMPVEYGEPLIIIE